MNAEDRAYMAWLAHHEQSALERRIREANGWRGRVVRAFFWLMRAWPA